jgi:hypothetical protein
MANANDDPNPSEYPLEWGYTKAPAGAVEAAFDLFAASLSDSEFDAMVSRTRSGGN